MSGFGIWTKNGLDSTISTGRQLGSFDVTGTRDWTTVDLPTEPGTAQAWAFGVSYDQPYDGYSLETEVLDTNRFRYRITRNRGGTVTIFYGRT